MKALRQGWRIEMKKALFWLYCLFFISWVLVSLWFLLAAKDADLFQSSGTLGIAAAILLFGNLQRQLSEISGELQEGEATLLKMEVLVANFEFLRQVKDCIVSSSNDEGSSDRRTIGEDERSQQIAKELNDQRPIVLKHRKLAKDLEQKHSDIRSRTTTLWNKVIQQEIFVVSIATIQTGFGKHFAQVVGLN